MSAMCARSLTHSVIRRAGVEFYALLIKQLGGENSWNNQPEIGLVPRLAKEILDKRY